MKYELDIPEANRQAHIDIEKDIMARKNGLFTFVLRVHDGKITDYSLMETVDAKTKYFSIAEITRAQFTVSRSY